MINLSEITPINIFFAWLSLVSITLFLWITFTLKRTHQKIKDIKELEEKKWKDLEDSAQRDYQEIISAANKKAQEIILRSTEIRQESLVTLQDSVNELMKAQNEAIKEISSAVSDKYEKLASQINEDNIKLLINIYKDIESSAKLDFAKYRQIIQKQTFEAEKIAEQRIKEEYEKLEIEIREARGKRLEELKTNINNIILNISKDVISKSLDISDHEELIIDALEKAKKEEIL